MIKTYEASGKTVEEAIDAALILANTTLDNVDVEVLELDSRGLFGFGRKDARVRISLEVAEKPAPKPERQPRPERQPKQPKPAEKRESSSPPANQPKEQPKEAKEAAATAPPKSEPREGSRNRNRGRQNPSPHQNQNRAKEQGESKPEAAAASPARETTHGYRITEGAEAEALVQEVRAFLNPILAKFQVQPQLTHEVKDGILWLALTGQGLGALIGRRGETLNALQYLTNLAVNRSRKEHIRLVLDVEGYRAGREETLVSLAKKMAEKAVRSGRRVELEPMNPHERRIVHLALQGDKRVDTTSQGEEPYRRVVISRRRGGNDRRRPPNQNQQRPQPEAKPAANLSFSEQLAEQFDQQIDRRR